MIRAADVDETVDVARLIPAVDVDDGDVEAVPGHPRTFGVRVPASKPDVARHAPERAGVGLPIGAGEAGELVAPDDIREKPGDLVAVHLRLQHELMQTHDVDGLMRQRDDLGPRIGVGARARRSQRREGERHGEEPK